MHRTLILIIPALVVLQWKDAWPEATLYGCPGLTAKHPEQGYDEEVGVDDAAPTCWLGEVQVAHMRHEAVPIFNVPFFSEARGCVVPSHSVWCACLRSPRGVSWGPRGVPVPVSDLD